VENLSTFIGNNWGSFAYIVPELIVATGVLTLLLLELFIQRHTKKRLIHTLVSLGFILAALVTLWMRHGLPPASLFNGLLVHDPFAWFFRAFVLLTTGITILMVPRYEALPTIRIGEFYALLLTILLGLMFLPAATDLLSILLSLETVSLLSYVLTGFRKGNRDSAQGALKYVIFGGVATGTMLYGFSLLYGLCGGTTLAELNRGFFRAISQGGGAGGLALSPVAFKLLIATAVVFILVGFAYKIAAAPFHLWTPDAYEGAPTPFTAFLSVGPKAAGLALFIRFFFGVFTKMNPAAWAAETFSAGEQFPWPALLAILAMATMTVGNLSALRQVRLKRLLAFSSIAHAGTMLMGIAAGTRLGAEAVLVYLCIYLFMNLGAFGLVSAVAAHTGGDHVSDFRGLARRSPFAAFGLAVFLFSLTGLPPLAGFIAKFYIFMAVLTKGGTLMWILAVVGGLNGAISLYYYAHVVATMYLKKSSETEPFRLSIGAGIFATCMILPTLIFGLYWTPLAEAAKSALKFPPLAASFSEAPVALPRTGTRPVHRLLRPLRKP